MLIKDLYTLASWAPEDGGAPSGGSEPSPTTGPAASPSPAASNTDVPPVTDLPAAPSWDQLDAMFGESATPGEGQSQVPGLPQVDGGSPAPQPAVQGTGQGQAAAAPAPVVPPPVQGPSEVETLRQQIAQLQGHVQALTAVARPPAQGQPSAPAPQPWQSPYHGNVRVDPEFVNLLRSENPAEAAQAYATMASNLAAMTHQHVMAEVGQLVGRVVQQVLPQQQEQREMARQAYTTFYNEWPNLQHPWYMPAVTDAAGQLVREGRVNTDSFMRDKAARRLVAERAVQLLKQNWPGGPPQRAPAPAPNAQAASGTPRGGPVANGADTGFQEQFAELYALG